MTLICIVIIAYTKYSKLSNPLTVNLHICKATGERPKIKKLLWQTLQQKLFYLNFIENVKFYILKKWSFQLKR